MNVVRIAFVTLREMSRRKLVIAAFALTLVTALLTGWGFYALVHQTQHGRPIAHAQVLASTAFMIVMLGYMFNLIFALAGAFVAAPALAGDIETGLLLPIATRPVRRSEIVLGKFAGILVMLCAYAYFAGIIEFAIARAVTGYWPPHPVVALASLCGVGITMLALTLLLSSRMAAIAGGVTAVVLYGLAWIGGIIGDIGMQVHSVGFANAGTVSQLILPSDAFWRAAAFHLEPVAMLIGIGSHATPFAVAAPPPLPMMLWGVGWIVVMLALACWSFTARDL